eukprot:TRINITY_DN212_c0_g1_i2.p1 TRINITY_DN212_c0_g1~~TRINITY_DN212_c0_g1_i2.p1  ORF type:complete len:688 (-),score=165.93 TRINITY_DN212_c0_g1_i2:888-2864(-)
MAGNDQNGNEHDPSLNEQMVIRDNEEEEFRIEDGGEGDLDLQEDDNAAGDEGMKGEENQAEDQSGQQSMRADEYGPQEWEAMEIPDEWQFTPIIRVKYVPKGVPEEELIEFLEGLGVQVRSVFVEPTAEQSQKYSCIVRLAPLPYAESEDEEQGGEGEEGDDERAKKGMKKSSKLPGYASIPAYVYAASYPTDGDVVEMGKWLIKKMASQKQLVLQGNTLYMECPFLYITMVISNLPSEWEDDVSLRKECEKYGTVRRCFQVTNGHGQRKGYAYVEFETYMAAKKAKESFDKMTTSTFQKIPQMRAQAAQDTTTNSTKVDDTESEVGDPDNEAPRFQIRIMRAEWAAPKKISELFGRHLYVANLKKGFDSSAEMKKLFEAYGPVQSCQVAKERGSNRAKDYGFVEFRRSDHADAAMRSLDGFDHEKMGKLAVSFIPPAKLTGNQQTPGGGGRRGGGRGSGRGGRGMRGGRGGGRGGGNNDMGYGNAYNMLPMMQQQQMQTALQLQQQQLRAMHMQQQQMALAAQQLQLQQSKAREELAAIAMQKQAAETELMRQQQTLKQQQQQQQGGVYASAVPQQAAVAGQQQYAGYNYQGQQQQQQYDQLACFFHITFSLLFCCSHVYCQVSGFKQTFCLRALFVGQTSSPCCAQQCSPCCCQHC